MTPCYALYLVTESAVDFVGTTFTYKGAERLKRRMERRHLRPVRRAYAQHGLKFPGEYHIVKI